MEFPYKGIETWVNAAQTRQMSEHYSQIREQRKREALEAAFEHRRPASRAVKPTFRAKLQPVLK